VKSIGSKRKYSTNNMSFSTLPEEIKVKIFNMLSLWDRYNASIVWEEMAYETWRKIPSHEDLINRLTDQNDATVRIKTLDDLEKAGILASAGYLYSLEKLSLQEIDIENVPINLVNCLIKVVKYQLRFWKVTGLSFQMLKNMKSKKLMLRNMTIPEQLTQDIIVRGSVSLSFISGYVSGFLDSITCDCIKIQYSKDTTAEGDTSRSMIEMLQSRVKELEFWDVKPFDYSLLATYNGQGDCKRMKFTDTQFGINVTKENLVPWANSNGWTVTLDERINFEIKRTIPKM